MIPGVHRAPPKSFDISQAAFNLLVLAERHGGWRRVAAGMIEAAGGIRWRASMRSIQPCLDKGFLVETAGLFTITTEGQEKLEAVRRFWGYT